MTNGGPVGPDGFTRLAESILNDAALVRMAQADGWDEAHEAFCVVAGQMKCDLHPNPYREASG